MKHYIPSQNIEGNQLCEQIDKVITKFCQGQTDGEGLKTRLLPELSNAIGKAILDWLEE